MVQFESSESKANNKSLEIPPAIQAAALAATVTVQGRATSHGEDGIPVGQAYIAKGTGFFIDDGHILTDSHLAENIYSDATVTTQDGTVHGIHLVKLDDVTDLAEYELDQKPSPGIYPHIEPAKESTTEPDTIVFCPGWSPSAGKISVSVGRVVGTETKSEEFTRQQGIVDAYNKAHGLGPSVNERELYVKAMKKLDPASSQDAEKDFYRPMLSASVPLETGASGAALIDIQGELRGVMVLAGWTNNPELVPAIHSLFTTLPEITAFLNSRNTKFNFDYQIKNGHTYQSIDRANGDRRPPFNALVDVEAKMQY